MPEHHNIDPLMETKLLLREHLLKQVAELDHELLLLLEQKKNEQYFLLSNQALKEAISLHSQGLKVREHAAFANVTLSTYYKALNEVDTVKVGTLQSVLNAIGLALYIGKQPAQTPALPQSHHRGSE